MGSGEYSGEGKKGTKREGVKGKRGEYGKKRNVENKAPQHKDGKKSKYFGS